jgi:MFS family permease
MAVTWTLAFSVCALLWGRLSDIFGRRWFFIWGNACCLIGAIMGSVAQNMTTMILANVFVGLANPAQLGFTIAIAELIPNKWRGYTNALFFCASLPFAVFGPVIARAFVTNTAAGWRWPYYLNVITSTLTLACFYFFYHPPKFDQLHTRHSKMDIIKGLDYVGVVLFTAGLTIFLLAINWGGTQHPWSSGATLGPLLGGLALLAILTCWGKSQDVHAVHGRVILIHCLRDLRRQESLDTHALLQECRIRRYHHMCRCRLDDLLLCKLIFPPLYKTTCK